LSLKLKLNFSRESNANLKLVAHPVIAEKRADLVFSFLPPTK
jgi:hypothetical protein